MKLYNEIEQQTPEWHYLRKGKVTGTTLKAIVGTSAARTKAFYKMVGERLSIGDMDSDEKPMDRGNRLENEARIMFEFQTGKTVLTTGFIESEENKYMGLSPDGGMENWTEQIEIKCPECQNYVEAWDTNKVPAEYYAQVIQSFIVNQKLKTMYFVLYHPEIPVHPMHIIIIQREDVQYDVESYKQKELEFLKEVDQKVSDILENYEIY